MDAQNSGGNFFKKNWLVIVIAAVLIVAGVVAAVYFTVIRDTGEEKTVTEKKEEEEPEDTKAEDTQARLESRIVFERDNSIWIMNPDGSGEKQLTSGEYDSSPSLSKDGKSIVFIRYAAPPVQNQSSFTPQPVSQIFIMDSDGGNARRLTPECWNTSEGWTPFITMQDGTVWMRRNCDYPSFSNDGKKICCAVSDTAYQESPDGGRGNYGLWAVAQMDIEGTEAGEIEVVVKQDDMFSGGYFGNPEYSKNDQQIYFTYAGGGGPPGVSVEKVDTNGKNREEVVPCEINLAEGGEDKGYYAFDISPDGRYIAVAEFSYDENGHYGKLLITDIDGSNKRYIDTPGVNVGIDRVSFSPDGNSIAFTDMNFLDQKDFMPSVYTIRSTGSGMQKISENADAPNWGWAATGTAP